MDEKVFLDDKVREIYTDLKKEYQEDKKVLEKYGANPRPLTEEEESKLNEYANILNECYTNKIISADLDDIVENGNGGAADWVLNERYVENHNRVIARLNFLSQRNASCFLGNSNNPGKNEEPTTTPRP